MSDSSQGPGWWQASDGKWYPPEQAPGYQQPTPSPYGGAPYGGGSPGTGGTDVGSTLSYAWNKFVQNIGEWVILWLITVGIRIVIGLIGVALGVGAGVAGMSGGGSYGLTVALSIVSGMVTGVLLVVLAKGAAQAVNGQRIDVGAAFQLTGNNISVGLLFGGLLGLLGIIPCLGVFLQIGAFLLLGFSTVLTALDDKGTDALSESVSLSTGRPGEAMLFWFIGGILSFCCFLLGAPVTLIGGAYLVKRYRGENVS